jgi:N-acetylmuramoyl-L-alanine amidase
MKPQEAYEMILLALCNWREARGEPIESKIAQAWSVRNRVQQPRWWGHDWVTVILKPFQYSSFNLNDPNASKFPAMTDASWDECLQVASDVYSSVGSDPTGGATSYYDTSIAPPAWTSSMTKTVQIGNFIFYKV